MFFKALLRAHRPTNTQEQVLVVFVPSKDVVSETFIRNHIDHLPFNVIARYDSELALRDEHGVLIWQLAGIIGRIAAKIRPSLRIHLRDFLLARHLRGLNAEVVLAEYGTTGCWLESACRKAEIPLVVHFHGFDASVRDLIYRNQKAYDMMFHSSRAIIAVSREMVNSLINLGAPKDKIYLNPYGVNPTIFKQARPEVQLPHFLAVGRLVEKKAPYLTILAFSKVHLACPESRLSIIGDGPLMGPCKRLIEALGLEDFVSLLGARTSSDVANIMQKSRAFVQHSLQAENGDTEGTPVAIIEAQMSGLPVVATCHAGIPDIIENGVTGFVVDEADIEGMAYAMTQLAMNPELAAEMGFSARQKAISNFTLENHINKLASILSMAAKKS